ncbi:hypothetical protein BDB13_5830 [Rhodococcus sp. OK302]|nr:hypothetical protein BDB13_5830 [Rhodococcus sp. OK302]
MPGKGSDPHLKDQELYEDLREQGDSKEKAARISNAAASRGTQERGQKRRRGGLLRGSNGTPTEETRQGDRTDRVLVDEQE